MATTETKTSTKTGGLLMKAFSSGAIDPIRWTEVTVGDLVVTVASDALKAELAGRPGVRLPATHAETVAICRELGCVPPTQAIADAMFAQAKAQLNFVPLVRTAADSNKMATVEFSLKFHDGVEKQLAAAAAAPGALIAGAWKYWLLHPRLAERGAVNYGFWDKSKKPPRPIQTPGACHDAGHYDYSQLLQPVKRIARRAGSGEEVDLLDYIEKHDRVPARFLEPLRPGATISPVTFADPYEDEVDLLSVLRAADVTVHAVDGWEKKGRPGFEPEGILVHHTAGPKTGDAPCLQVCLAGRPDLPGPLCHIYLSRSGTAHLLAANITNHAGMGAREVLDQIRRGEPVIDNAVTHGYTDAIGGNTFFYGIEVENSGTKGDAYPPAQIEALVRICAALCQAHRWSSGRVIHHRQWTKRKIDMSFRGSLPGLVAQRMDAGAVSFGMDDDPTEPMWEPEPEAEPAV